MLRRTGIKAEKLLSGLTEPCIIITKTNEHEFLPEKPEHYSFIKPDKLLVSTKTGSSTWLNLQNFRFLNFILPREILWQHLDFSSSFAAKEIQGKIKNWKGRFRQLPVFENSEFVLECETITQMKLNDSVIFGNKIKVIWNRVNL
ncbi:MAG: hypothetical protein CSB55_03400 [Candidatus Cloacimonadota bacterium]|nr:MAG: hypothetical protein CSB55_03400 [Candidatus Cloacimonadota bacterium]